MATMPKCSGPTAWTRGVSWPLGCCRTKALRALAGRGVRRRGMMRSFRETGWCILDPKGRVGKKRQFLFFANPHTTVITGAPRKAAIFSGCDSHPATVAPAGSNRRGEGGNELAEASGAEGRFRRLGEPAGRNSSERHRGLETTCCGSRPGPFTGKAVVAAFRGATRSLLRSHRGKGDGMLAHGDRTQRGRPPAVAA
jgi:hypothetical protein